MMVCFNAAPTLAWAFGSLLAQSWKDWECIFVNDGSTDDSYELAVGLGDPRIKAFRLERNRGRGPARQFALERAEGEYLCILDADDWMYPWRIQAEVEFLEAEPSAAVVSAGMAIQGKNGNLVGTRGGVRGDHSKLYPPITRLQMPPLSFPASMVRTRVAKLCRFDDKLPTVEDIDFLLQLIFRNGYGILNRNVYTYTEYSTVTLPKLLEASHFCSETFRKYSDRFPVQSTVSRLKVLGKSMIYRGAFAMNRSNWLVGRRSQSPTLKEEEEFQLARGQVSLEAERISGASISHPPSSRTLATCDECVVSKG